MIATTQKVIGKGIYSPAEAALYARVRTPLLTRWVFGTNDGDSVFPSEFDPEDKTISFRDLVQTLAVRAIRFDETKVPLSRIRDAVKMAQQVYGLDFPLSRKHVILVNPHTRHLYIELPDKRLVQASGDHKKNTVMRPIVESFLMNVDFGEDGLACRYRPMRDGERSIVLDPERRFGEPIVEPCGYSAWTLYDSFVAEGSLSKAAAAYQVDEEDVRLAVSYLDSLLVAGDVESAKPKR
jgi:uncharacterized protein (DUF433 family)